MMWMLVRSRNASCALAAEPDIIDYDEFVTALRQRKAERWAKILASEPPGPAPGRRPRSPEKERLLAKLDRIRLERRRAALAGETED